MDKDNSGKRTEHDAPDWIAGLIAIGVLVGIGHRWANRMVSEHGVLGVVVDGVVAVAFALAAGVAWDLLRWKLGGRKPSWMDP